MKKNHKQSGFTLVELLISFAIAIICATVLVAIITSTFRSSSNATTRERLRISGMSALSQTTKMIKYAEEFNNVQTIDDKTSEICVTPDSEETHDVKSLSFTYQGKIKELACDNRSQLILGDYPLTDNNPGKPLIDEDSVNVTGCEISCTQVSAADQPVITLTLDLSNPPGVEAQEQQGNIQISQSVRMVNYSQ